MINKTAHELRDERADLYDEAAGIGERLEAENRDANKAETKRMQTIEIRIGELTKAIQKREEYERRLAANSSGISHKSDPDFGRIEPATGDKFAYEFAQRAFDVARTGAARRIPIDPKYVFQPQKRAVMISDSGSAGKSLKQSTLADIYAQATESDAFLSALTVIGTENNAQVPYLDRDNRVTAQNKSETAALTEQAYIIDCTSVALKNYYTFLGLANNVIRDAAPQIETFVTNFAVQDVRRQVAADVISGSGASNNLTGITNMSGILTQDWASANITDWTMLTGAFKSLMDKNVNRENISLVIPPTLWEWFAELVDTTGQPMMMPEWIKNLQIFVTPHMAYNQAVIGDLSRLQLYVWKEAEISVASSPDYAFGKDQTFVRCLWRGDLKSTEPDHVLLIDNIITNT